MAYCTLADVRSWLGIYDPADDPELTLALAAAEESVGIWCGYDFDLAAQPSTRIFAPASRYLLDLSAAGYTIGNTAGLGIAVDDDDDGTYELVWTAADWQTEPLNATGPGGVTWPVTHLRAVGDHRFPVGGSGRARVQVTARWGWPAVPASVKTATMMLAASWHQRRATVTGRSGFDGYFSAAIRDDPTIQDLLAPYRAGVPMVGFG